MLNWNAEKVKNLSGLEIWLFILARVLIAFGIGALAEKYFPQFADALAIPILIVGTILFAFAARGLLRKSPR